MKEIGEFLKNSRTENGVSIEEAADDLNIAVTQLENIELGNIRAFKDIYVLRDLVKEYGKYLGVETSVIVDEFNDFMFEHTSKISLDDLVEARKNTSGKELEKPRVISPYTKIRKSKIRLTHIKIKPLIICIAIVVVLIVSVLLWNYFNKNDDIVTSELQGINGEEIYEFTY